MIDPKMIVLIVSAAIVLVLISVVDAVHRALRPPWIVETKLTAVDDPIARGRI